jgi:hypothetical protein
MRRVAVSVAAGFLLLTALPASSLADPPGTLDQSQTAGTATIGTTADVYQTFTVGVTGTLTGVQIYMNGGATATATVAIQATAGGNPTLTDLVSVSAAVPAADGLVDFTFAAGVPVTAGDVLAIRINTGAETAAWGSATDVYAGGQAMWLNGGWQAVPGIADFRFQTFVQVGAPPDFAPTATLAPTATPQPTSTSQSTTTPPPTATASRDGNTPGFADWLLPFAIALAAAALVTIKRSVRQIR